MSKPDDIPQDVRKAIEEIRLGFFDFDPEKERDRYVNVVLSRAILAERERNKAFAEEVADGSNGQMAATARYIAGRISNS